jgi:hypothetical protein
VPWCFFVFVSSSSPAGGSPVRVAARRPGSRLAARSGNGPGRSPASKARAVPGLIRKQFIYAEDGWAGGVYLSETRAAAEAFYGGPWLNGIRERYGMDPQVRFFETACVTDNAIGAVRGPYQVELAVCTIITRIRGQAGPKARGTFFTPVALCRYVARLGSKGCQ